MSDIKKWMKIMESVPATFPRQSETQHQVKRDATVMVNPRRGGGIGRFMHTTSNGVMIDVKGVPMELSNDDWSLPERDNEDPYTRGNDWFHMSSLQNTPGTFRDKPEFSAGDIVKVADVYGTIIGPGLGIFVAYSTSGTECVISFDEKEIIVPTSNVGAVLEQDAKNNFDDLDNDGNLSTLSLGSKNVKIEEPAMDQRDEFSKWMSAVEEALSSEAKPVAEDVPPMMNECGCGNWDCPMCFPEQDEMPGMQGQMDGMGGMSPNVVVMGNEMDDEMGAGMMNGMNPLSGDVCPTCGHPHAGGEEHEVEFEVPFGEDGSAGGMGAAGMASGTPQPMVDEDPMGFDDNQPSSKPRFEKGSKGGVKLGHIIQKFVAADQDGEDSPLTYGEDNLDEEDSWYEPAQSEFGDLDHEADRRSAAEFGIPSDSDIENMEEMAGKIKFMQVQGFSKSSTVYDENDFQMMSPSQLKKAYDTVMGTVSEDDEPMSGAEPTGVTPPSSAATGGSMGGGGSPASPGGNYAPGTAPTMPESINKRGLIKDNMMENMTQESALIDAIVKIAISQGAIGSSIIDPMDVDEIIRKSGHKDVYRAWKKMAGAQMQMTDDIGSKISELTDGSDSMMENVDKDVAAMLRSLKKYDTLKESVLGMVTLGEKKDSKPEWLIDVEKKAEGKDVKKDDKKSGKKEKVDEAKECKVCHEAPCVCDDTKINEGADTEVLNWMKRFSNLGNMKGYGR